jgi:hypothetical protein
MGERVRSSGLQQAHYGCSATEEVEPAVVGGNMLMRAGAGTEEVTQFIVASTKPVGRSWAFAVSCSNRHHGNVRSIEFGVYTPDLR